MNNIKSSDQTAQILIGPTLSEYRMGIVPEELPFSLYDDDFVF